MTGRPRYLPGKALLWALAAGCLVVLAALVAGLPRSSAQWLAAGWCLVLLLLVLVDLPLTARAWREAAPDLTRTLPAAFAIGVPAKVQLALAPKGKKRWRVRLHDHADPSLTVGEMPVKLDLRGGTGVELTYAVLPTRRGEIEFAPAEIRAGSRLRLLDLCDRIGVAEARRCYPDFAQIGRYAWLAGDRRLAEIGIKTYQQRGEGTDFKQLSEYRIGDPVRHIDWKATARQEKLIVRQFQNERDQYVILMIDCGRRMRADEQEAGPGRSHFDQVLNATMLLTYVALKQGDAVGVTTFGTPPGEGRWVPPRKGARTLNTLMGELYAVQPSPTHSDYLAAAQELLRRHYKRSLVIVITNFRDEDSAELHQALTLLRSRHLVLTASLRERIVNTLMWQGVRSLSSALEVSGAHLYEQARRDAFNRLAARDALMVDAEPEWLGVALVNRYQAVKKAGLI